MSLGPQKQKKQEQQKAKAPPPGTSRILQRATREQKRAQNKQGPQVIQPKMHKPQADQSPSKPDVVEQEHSKAATPVIPSDRPESAGRQGNESRQEKPSKAVENDADEWQSLAEELNPGRIIKFNKRNFVFFKNLLNTSLAL